MSFFDCRHYRPWPTNSEDNEMATKNFEEWLHTYQFSEEQCAKGVNNITYPAGGIGASFISYISSDFMGSIERQVVFRPTVRSVWAEQNPSECTLGKQWVDCHFQPLSSCGMPQDSVPPEYRLSSKRWQNTTLGQQLQGQFVDFCSLARASQKPTVWVLGQIFRYFMRPSSEMTVEIEERVRRVLKSNPGKHYLAIHLRAGVLDQGRRHIPLDSYLEVAMEQVKVLATEGKEVTMIYIAAGYMDSQHQVTEQDLQRRYNTTIHFEFAQATKIKGDELEFYVRAHMDVSRKPFFVEFLTDMELFARADSFVGSRSCMYIIAASLRYALFPNTPKHHCCHLALLEGGHLTKNCESDPKGAQIWQYYHLGGHQGGVSF
eukprot:scaffold10607_cov159-Ochromonas_danica.AAC.1